MAAAAYKLDIYEGEWTKGVKARRIRKGSVDVRHIGVYMKGYRSRVNTKVKIREENRGEEIFGKISGKLGIRWRIRKPYKRNSMRTGLAYIICEPDFPVSVVRGERDDFSLKKR